MALLVCVSSVERPSLSFLPGNVLLSHIVLVSSRNRRCLFVRAGCAVFETHMKAPAAMRVHLQLTAATLAEGVSILAARNAGRSDCTPPHASTPINPFRKNPDPFHRIHGALIVYRVQRGV